MIGSGRLNRNCGGFGHQSIWSGLDWTIIYKDWTESGPNPWTVSPGRRKQCRSYNCSALHAYGDPKASYSASIAWQLQSFIPTGSSIFIVSNISAIVNLAVYYSSRHGLNFRFPFQGCRLDYYLHSPHITPLYARTFIFAFALFTIIPSVNYFDTVTADGLYCIALFAGYPFARFARFPLTLRSL